MVQCLSLSEGDAGGISVSQYKEGAECDQYACRFICQPVNGRCRFPLPLASVMDVSNSPGTVRFSNTAAECLHLFLREKKRRIGLRVCDSAPCDCRNTNNTDRNTTNCQHFGDSGGLNTRLSASYRGRFTERRLPPPGIVAQLAPVLSGQAVCRPVCGLKMTNVNFCKSLNSDDTLVSCRVFPARPGEPELCRANAHVVRRLRMYSRSPTYNPLPTTIPAPTTSCSDSISPKNRYPNTMAHTSMK